MDGNNQWVYYKYWSQYTGQTLLTQTRVPNQIIRSNKVSTFI